jgi:type I restriction enzyme S subunit
MTNTAIPAGYKQTEVGIIPEDWSVHNLGSLVYGVEYGSSAKSKESGKIPVLRMGNIQDGKVDYSDLVFTDDDSEIKKHLLKFNDVLFNRTNTVDLVGKTAIFKSKMPAIFAGYLIRINVNNNLLDSDYLNYWLNARVAKNYSQLVLSVAVGQANINGVKLKTYPVALPQTVEEQTAIATVLSDVDALITSLNAQIAKKRDIKTAAMQQLLTGKQRLAGFEGDWEWKKFNDVVYGFSSGSTPYRQVSNFYKGNIKWVTSGELNYNIVFDTIEKISSDALKSASLTIHPAETFLMAITGLEAQGTRGSCAILGVPATTNQSCMALYPKENFSIYYLYYYYCYFGDDFAFEYCQGTKQQSYTAKIVKILPIKVPPTKEEQEAIAGVLSAMDEDIAALEQRLAKTKALKQGMMQELLTGRTRLVVGSTKPSPFDLYEQTKRENFVHSSRLEGIDIPSKQTPASLADVLKKYSVD